MLEESPKVCFTLRATTYPTPHPFPCQGPCKRSALIDDLWEFGKIRNYPMTGDLLANTIIQFTGVILQREEVRYA